MRKTYTKQLPLCEATPVHPKTKELEEISKILDQNICIYEKALQDITTARRNVGAQGMSAEQVVRAAIIKQMEGYSYEELAFHIADSKTYRKFCKIGILRSFSKSALHVNIKALSPGTWETINRSLVEYAAKVEIEKGRKVRIDCTVVESNIHEPYDSELLWDSVRVLTRILNRARDGLCGLTFDYVDHSRRSKRRCLEVRNAKNDKQRKRAYKDLIGMAEHTVTYSESAVDALRSFEAASIDDMVLSLGLFRELVDYLPLVRQIICQTTRRIIYSETVPAPEKLVSLFEPHTDIIKKDRRETFYGHKICLTGGASNLILDCKILEGNPADATLTQTMLERQKDFYGRPPLKVALDGGFASKENLDAAKLQGIKDVCFSKGRGLDEEDMCRSRYIYKALRKFRAGIESGISWLKRVFGLDRCLWKGFESFESYVWASIVSANLLTLARKQLA